MEQIRKIRTIAHFDNYDAMLDNAEKVAEILGVSVEELFIPYTESQYGGYNLCLKKKLTFIEGRRLESKVRRALAEAKQ